MKITVYAGAHSRICCPVTTVLPLVPSADLCLREQETGSVVSCQWRTDGKQTTLYWILDALDAHATRSYEVSAVDEPGCPPMVSLSDTGTEVRVAVAGDLFTSYHYSSTYARPFLYPVIGPYGHGITRNYPMVADVEGEKHDHPHHRSLFTAFGDVNGVDDWSEAEGHGRIAHRGFPALESGPVYGRIVAENDWVSQEGTFVVAETREIVFYGTPRDTRLIDYSVTFRAGSSDVVFGDTKEGGILSVRVPTSMDVSSGLGGQITNTYGGINEEETWGRRSPWCDYSGPVAGRVVGIAIMDHPDNLRYPTQWHVRTYGLMTANCFGWSYYKDDKSIDGSYTLAAHTDRVFRYRVVVHPGRAGTVSARFVDFAFPPQVTVGD